MSAVWDEGFLLGFWIGVVFTLGAVAFYRLWRLADVSA